MIPYKKLIFLICCLPLTAGCWDNLEVEDRSFVTGIAIDLATNKDNNKPAPSEESAAERDSQGQQQQNSQQQSNQPSSGQERIKQNQNESSLQTDERVLNYEKDEDYEQNDNNKFKLTQQLLNPSTFSSQQNTNNSNATSFRNLSQTGDTIIEMNRDMIKQAGSRTNVTHLNIVLFSEALAKEEYLFADLMDIFLREKEMLRSVKIAITEDQSSDYLSILPENEKIPSKYLSKVLENKSTLDIAQPLTVGNVQSYLLMNRSFIIPFISQVNTTTVNYDGVSVYSGIKNKVVGNLIGDEAKGVNFIQSKNQTGTINTKLDDHDVTFEILNIQSKISLKDKKMPLQFDIKIDVASGVAEQYGHLDVMKEENYQKLKRTLEKEIKEITEHTISILQNELYTDVIGLNTYLYEKHYPLWKSIKEEWEEGQHYFIKSDIQVDVNATIEKPGNIIKSH